MSVTCNNIDCTGFTGSLVNPSSLNIFGNLTFSAGMTFNGTSGTRIFFSTAAGKTITTAGKDMRTTVFNGVGGSWTLQDDYLANGSSVTLTNGTLNTNSKSLSFATFALGVGTKVWNAAASIINVLGSSFDVTTNSAGFTFNAGTSKIVFNPSSGTPGITLNNLTFYDIEFIKSAGGVNINGSGTIHDLTQNNTVLGGGNRALSIQGGVTINVTGIFTYIGINATNSRGRITSTGTGTPVIINLGTTGTASLSNIDVEDISFVGTNTPVIGVNRFGDCGGNSGITLTAGKNFYWIGGAGIMTDVGEWSLTSGGSPGSEMPLPQDRAIFDANSFSTSGQVVRNNMMRAPSIDFSAATISPVYNPENPNGAGNVIYGDLILNSTMSYTCTGAAGGATSHSFRGRGNHVVNMAGLQNPSNVSTNLSAYGGSYTQLSHFWMGPLRQFGLSIGSWDMNGFDFEVGQFSSNNTSPRAFYMRTGTMTISGSGVIWQTGNTGNFTLDVGTSKTVISDLSATTKTITFGDPSSGLLGYRQFYDVEIPANSVGIVEFSNSATRRMHKLTAVGGGQVIAFTSGSVYQIDELNISGVSGSTVTLQSRTAGIQYILQSIATLVDSNYLTITDSKAEGSTAWYAGANSVNGGNNTGWLFVGAPTFNAPMFEAMMVTPGVGTEVHQTASIDADLLTTLIGLYAPDIYAQRHHSVDAYDLALFTELLVAEAAAQKQTSTSPTSLALTVLLQSASIETNWNATADPNVFQVAAHIQSPTVETQLFVSVVEDLLSAGVSLIPATISLMTLGRPLYRSRDRLFSGRASPFGKG